MKQKTSEQIIAEEINQIITTCKKIAQLSPQTVIPEEYCWNPKPASIDPVYKNKLVNTNIHLDLALTQLSNAYDKSPLTDDHALTKSLSNIMSEVNTLCLYYKELINGSN